MRKVLCVHVLVLPQQVNPLNVKITEPNTVSVPNLQASNKTRDQVLLREKPDIQVILSYDFNAVNHPLYHKPGYGFNEGGLETYLMYWQTNQTYF